MKINRSSLLPPKKALLWILLSILFVSGTGLFSYSYFRYIKRQYASDSAYNIVAIVQSTSENEALKIGYLAELLDLSVDQPTNLYRFNAAEAQRKLITHPLIKYVRVRKIRPGTLYIEYDMRQPIAFLADYTNTLIDQEGFLFPYRPFFTPKKLPDVYLGVAENNCGPKKEIWGERLYSSHGNLAIAILQTLKNHSIFAKMDVKRIDVSHAFTPSCGQREIIVQMEEYFEKGESQASNLFIIPWTLRLSHENYEQDLVNFSTLREYLVSKSLNFVSKDKITKMSTVLVDLRLPQLATFKI